MYNVFLGGLMLPIAPGAINTKVNNKNVTVTLINDGEINILKTAGLTEVSFEFMLPYTKYPFSTYGSGGYVGQKTFLTYLEKLKTSKLPFQFIVSRMTPDNKKLLFHTNLKAALEDYEIKEDADNGLDLMVSVNLKQYKDYSTKELVTDKNGKTTVKKTRGKSSVLSISY